MKFSATGHDFRGVALAVTCTPRSGVPFPLGRTVVTCTTRDSYGGSAKGSFTVTVVDTTAPVLSTPETLAFDAKSPAGATVDFAVAVSDAVSTSLTAGCDPASGSVFAIGDVNVRCTATDAAGNTGETAFVLHVRGADEQLDALAELVTSWRVETSLADKLLGQIADVRKHLDATQGSADCGGLKELSDLAAKESGKGLTADQSSRLVGEVSRITGVVGC